MHAPAATARCILILAASCTLLGAADQDPRGEITGRVTDPSGSVIAGAKVTALRAAISQTTTTTTNSSGDYLLPFLNDGEYVVTVEHTGFQLFREPKVTVRAGESTTLDVKLALPATSHSVQVLASSSHVDGSISVSGIVADSDMIDELPIRDGNPVLVALLAAGVADLNEGGTTRAYDNENSSNITVNGSSSGTHEFKIDGAANTGGSSGNVAYTPPAGVVSEVKVDTFPVDVRNGFSSGATLNIGLKGGTKLLHGQVYSYLENPATNANSFFSNKAATRDNFREVRYGATANGPLPLPFSHSPNRTFWMYGFEAIHASQPYGSNNLSYTLPTATERLGNFADLLAYGSSYQIYDPATTRPATTSGRYTRDPFPGNIVPSSRLNQTALNIIAKYYPLPNIPGAKPTGADYTMPSIQDNDFDSHTFRIDQAIGEKHRLFVRGSLNYRDQSLLKRFFGGAGTDGERDNQGIGVDDAYFVGHNFLLDVRYNYTRYVDNYEPPTAGLDITTLGFSQNYANQIRAIDARNLMLPDITITGYPELSGQVVTRLASDIHAFAADVTRTAAAHIVHFGGEYRIYRDASGNTGRSAGKLNFATTWALGPLDNSAASPMGQGLASFLLGLPTDGSMDVNPSLAQQYQVSGWYAQDTWKVRPRLTISYGVRWEYEIPLTERYNRSVRAFDPYASLSIASAVETAYNKAPVVQIAKNNFPVSGGLTFAGVNGEPRTLWAGDSHNLAPRVAFAWMPRSKMVLRGSYGIFYDIARQNAIQTGFSRSTTLVASSNNGQTYTAGINNPFPSGILLPTGTSLGAMTNVGQSISAFPDHLFNPYVQRWETTLQRELGSQSLIQVAYVGNRATRLRVSRQLDAIPAWYLSKSPFRDNAVNTTLTTYVANPFYPLLPNTSLSSSTVSVGQLLRPYPQFTGISTSTNDGYSWYHSLQASLQKRFTKKYLLTVAYTWSKFMEAITYLNDPDPFPSRVISSQDRPQRLVVGFTYSPAPLRRGKVAGAFSRGWQVQGIVQEQSGAPLSFGNVLYLGAPVALPDSQRSVTHWFNTAAFDRGSATQLVYNLRTFPLRLANVRSMGVNRFDLGATRNFSLNERLRATLRADAYNAFNHTQFSSPNTSPTSTDFGAITSTSQLPRVVEVSLRLQF